MEEVAQLEPRRLADFLRDRAEDILAHWEIEVMKVKSARKLSRPLLLDHLPDFLADLAHYVDDLRHGKNDSPPDENPRIHALERLEVGYDLAEVVEEYSVLRRSITELAFAEHAPALRSGELPRLHEAIDQAISTSVVRYTEARERTLRALDRISSAALVHHDVEALLPGTLDAFLATTAAVDTVALALREDGELRIRAAFGYPPPGPVGKICARDHFSSRVEATRAPLFITDACSDPLIGTSPTCAPGTRALYGVPLILGEDILGVAVMGSRSAYEFSQEDQFLFRTMVNRAATLIAQARLDQQLRAHVAELEAVIESIPQGVYVGNEKGIRRANRAALQMLGFDSTSELAENLETLASDAAPRSVDGKPLLPEERVFNQALLGKSAQIEMLVRNRKTGKDLVVHSSAAPIRMGKTTIGAVAVNTDITERIQKEQVLRDALEYRDRMLGVLSHDLRNPLSVIATSTSLLHMGNLDEKQRRAVTRVAANASRIERMVHDLLDYTRSRLPRGLPVTPQQGDLRAVCQQVVENMQVLHPDRTIVLKAAGPAMGTFDPERALQAISNLLANALRYSPPDAQVTVSLEAAPEGLWLSVHNAGEPIAPEVMPRLFDAFARGVPDESGRSAGLGLGLYIVKQIMEAHGGRVEVVSTRAQGTTFRVLWPGVVHPGA
ncbi:MAG TPA: ATP-binding protein [Myxococcales bacterium]|jgi:PAS domain S-box-containing protein